MKHVSITVEQTVVQATILQQNSFKRSVKTLC